MPRQARAAVRPAGSSARQVATAEEPRRRSSHRESVESFVVVFVGFLVWSIEAEGFVIPTGSMAPTLMGRHKEVTCPECSHVYTVNADSEADPSGGSTGIRVDRGTCVNCRFTARIHDEPSFTGDRVYTMKTGVNLPFLPAAGRIEPKRWEVTVFKLPEEPEVRYIKRLVGLPNEVIRIQQGDIWGRPLDASTPYGRLRRPPDHLLAMQVMVHDDAHRAKSLRGDDRWRRWVPTAGSSWKETTPGTFVVSGPASGRSELRYRNMVPDPVQWEAISEGRDLPTEPRPTLITDFSSYNTDSSLASRRHPRLADRPWLQTHWVGDLTLSLDLKVTSPEGRLVLEMVKGESVDRCVFDIKAGTARLRHGDEPLGESAPVPLAPGLRHRITLANVDDCLTLWVDGTLPFGNGRSYGNPEPGDPILPTDNDLEPVRIVADAASAELTGLVLRRDIYYTRDPGQSDQDSLRNEPIGPGAFFDLLASPSRYGSMITNRAYDYALGPGRYLMLGDNSPWSRDGRAWGRSDRLSPGSPDEGWDDTDRESWEVPESLLIGKAFCVYWPHLKPFWPSIRLSADFRLPVRPYVEKVRWVR